MFTYIRKHAKWVQRDYRGEIVSSKNMDKFQSKHGMKHIKSQFKKTKKKMPLFLKHFNGWHQNVKLNIHFEKKLKMYIYM